VITTQVEEILMEEEKAKLLDRKAVEEIMN
jgi:hypothetical protein